MNAMQLLSCLRKPGFPACLLAGLGTLSAAFAEEGQAADPALGAPASKAAGQGQAGAQARLPAIPPTRANVAYGPHERNVLDLWKAESAEPTPLVLYIHGGGFRSGRKESIEADTLGQLLEAGISVAAVEYRLLADAPLPAAHRDARRALQFLRSKAKEWGVDPTRAGAFGGSAGAQICMWLAFHDDMADPASADPIARESTRLACVATSGGQTTRRMEWWMKWIPGYDQPHREEQEFFGPLAGEALSQIIDDISALSLLTADDPPIFMTYGMKPDAPIPADPKQAQGWKVHHVVFGVKLKEKADQLGVEADLKYPGAKTAYPSISRFFIDKLKPNRS